MSAVLCRLFGWYFDHFPNGSVSVFNDGVIYQQFGQGRPMSDCGGTAAEFANGLVLLRDGYCYSLPHTSRLHSHCLFSAVV